MQWTRLHTGYWRDDKIVTLRAGFGYEAEAFVLRMIAQCGDLEGPIVVPKNIEFKALAEMLGFPSETVVTVTSIAQEAVRIGLCSRAERGGKVRWDLRNRARWQVPKSLRPADARERKRRSRANSVTVTSQGSHWLEEKREEEKRTDPPEHPSDVLPPTEQADDEGRHLVGKYLGQLGEMSPAWKKIGDHELIEVASDLGFSILQAGRMLGALRDWWKTAPPSKRWKHPLRGWRRWCQNERDRRDREREQASLTEPPPPEPSAPPPDVVDWDQHRDQDLETDEEREARLAQTRERVAEKLRIPLDEVDEQATRAYFDIRADELEAAGRGFMAEAIRKLARGETS